MSWLSSVFGGGHAQNPAGAAMPYLDQAMGQYSNPDVYNTMRSQYKESPEFSNKLRRALEAQKNMAAAGGMAGSLQSQTQGAETASDLANQDFHRYLAERLGISEDMASILGQKAGYGYAGQAGMNTANAANSNNWMNLIGGLGGAALGSYGNFANSPLGFLFGVGNRNQGGH